VEDASKKRPSYSSARGAGGLFEKRLVDGGGRGLSFTFGHDGDSHRESVTSTSSACHGRLSRLDQQFCRTFNILLGVKNNERSAPSARPYSRICCDFGRLLAFPDTGPPSIASAVQRTVHLRSRVDRR
jgi:hypothetical protein